jgi:hypothetical protein
VENKKRRKEDEERERVRVGKQGKGEEKKAFIIY